MPPSKEPPEVSRRILDTMATIARAHHRHTEEILGRIDRNDATLVDLDYIARLSNLTIPEILAMARDDSTLDESLS